MDSPVTVAPSVSPQAAAELSSQAATDTTTGNTPDIHDILSKHKEKIKINGVERELTYQEMKVLAGKAYASDEKFRQASEKEKIYSDVDKVFKNKDFKTFMTKAGINDPKEARTILEELLIPYYEDEAKKELNPDAYRAEKAEKELAKFREDQEKETLERKTKEEQEFENKQVHAYFAELDHQFNDGFKKMGMKPDRFYHDLAIREMRDAVEDGHELSVYDALKLADKEIDKMIKRRFMDISQENIMNYLGKEGIKKIREFDTKKVVQANSVLRPIKQSENAPTSKRKEVDNDRSRSNQPESRESIDSYFNRIRAGIK